MEVGPLLLTVSEQTTPVYAKSAEAIAGDSECGLETGAVIADGPLARVLTVFSAGTRAARRTQPRVALEPLSLPHLCNPVKLPEIAKAQYTNASIP